MNADLKYVESLMRLNYEAVGFIPRPRLEWYAARNQVLTENDVAIAGVRPVKRTLKLLSQQWVPKDRPKLDVLLVSLAFNGGNVGMTAQALRPSYSYMWSIQRAERYTDFALRAFWAAYREEDSTYRHLSEAQLDAESERRAA